MKLQRALYLFLALAPLLCQASPPDCISSPQVAIDKITAKIIVIGEMLGTEQAPAFVGQLACGLLKQNRPVVVALERNGTEQEALNRYLTSAGQPADIRALLSGPSWALHPQDGHNSQAMLKLLDQLRQWRQGGQPVGVLAMQSGFRPVVPPETIQMRPYNGDEMARMNGILDRSMADNVWIASVIYGGYTVIALARDVHAAAGSKARALLTPTPSFADVLSSYAPIHVIGLTSGGRTSPTARMYMTDSRIDSQVDVGEITVSPPAGSN